MKNWTIGKQITAGLALILLGAVALGVSWIISSRTVGKNVSLFKADVLPGLASSGSITALLAENHVYTLLMAQDPGSLPSLRERVEKASAEIGKQLEKYDKSITVPEARAQFDALKAEREAYKASRIKFVALVDSGQKEALTKFVSEELSPAFDKYFTEANNLLQWNVNHGAELVDVIGDVVENAIYLASLLTVIVLAVCLVIGTFTVREVRKVLVNTIQSLTQSTAELAAASQQVASSSQGLAQASTEQAASLEETAATLEEISTGVTHNAENSKQAELLSKDVQSSSSEGQEAMRRMREAIEEIEKAATETAQIVKTIDEIAFQTNLLALNAAVEAARAGESGKGFAVVAEEVRTLAQRSAVAARDTSEKIGRSTEMAEKGVAVAAEASRCLAAIEANAERSTGIVLEIAAATQEQARSIATVNAATKDLEGLTQSNSAAAEESAAASEELLAQINIVEHVLTGLREKVHGKQGGH